MIAVVAGDIAGTGVGDRVKLPGGLTVISRVNEYYTGIEIDQVVLLAAMRVVAGVAGAKGVELVQVLIAIPEHGSAGRVDSIAVGIKLVALETQLTWVVDGRAASRRTASRRVYLSNVLSRAIQDMQQWRAVWAVGGIVTIIVAVCAVDNRVLRPWGDERAGGHVGVAALCSDWVEAGLVRVEFYRQIPVIAHLSWVVGRELTQTVGDIAR